MTMMKLDYLTMSNEGSFDLQEKLSKKEVKHLDPCCLILAIASTAFQSARDKSVFIKGNASWEASELGFDCSKTFTLLQNRSLYHNQPITLRWSPQKGFQAILRKDLRSIKLLLSQNLSKEVQKIASMSQFFKYLDDAYLKIKELGDEELGLEICRRIRGGGKKGDRSSNNNNNIPPLEKSKKRKSTKNSHDHPILKRSKIEEEPPEESETRSNLLNTPLDIYNYAKKYFPKAKAKIVKTDGNSCRMKLTLFKGYTIKFQSSIITELFNQKLLNLDILRSNKNNSTFPILNTGQIAVESPLLNWQAFNRALHKEKGMTCAVTIKNYLLSAKGGDDQEIRSLGLAPDQIKQNLSPADMDEFIAFSDEIINKIKDQEQKNSLFKALKEKYAEVFQQLIEKIHSQKVKKSRAHHYVDEILKDLNESVVGQDYVANTLASVLDSQRKNEKNGTFLFAGPSGVGKTKMAETVAKLKNGRLTKFFMGQYSTSVMSSSFFGSGAGYVGSTDRPPFAKEMDRWDPRLIGKENDDTKLIYEVSNVVILLDEIEKAHNDVRQTLLELVEARQDIECKYTDDNSRKNMSVSYRLKKCVVIATSNVYSDKIVNDLQGGIQRKLITDELFDNYNLQNYPEPIFKPEFLNRFKALPFGPIPRGPAYQGVIKIELDKYLKVLKIEIECKKIEVENREDVLTLLEERLYGDGTGTRKIERYLNKIKEAFDHRDKKKWRPIEEMVVVLFVRDNKLWIKPTWEYFGQPYCPSNQVEGSEIEII